MPTSIVAKGLLFALLLATSSAWALWINMGETDTGIFYVDPVSILKNGNLRKVWVITDLKERDPDGHISTRVRYEFDCKGEVYRYLALSTHSEPMAAGKTIAPDRVSSPAWNEIPPGTFVASILSIVCAM